jgi:uncharacterized membrane protein YdjX (TVP38/TMEM64 family)
MEKVEETQAKSPANAARDDQTPVPTGKRYRLWIALILLPLLLVAGWQYGPTLWILLQDQEALQAWVHSFGWLGPIILVLLNALQIIVAPIPGYAVQFVAGFLYGPWWGGLWANMGLMLGATLAMWLARTYGQPLVVRLVGEGRLERWEKVTHSNSTLVWFVLIAGPTGDLPYYLAGLAHVSFAKIIALLLLVRVPSTFVVTAVGAGVMILSWFQIALIFAGLALMTLLFFRYQDRLLQWTDRHVYRQIAAKLSQDQA